MLDDLSTINLLSFLSGFIEKILNENVEGITTVGILIFKKERERKRKRE